jgi:hypothetical protein
MYFIWFDSKILSFFSESVRMPGRPKKLKKQDAMGCKNILQMFANQKECSKAVVDNPETMIETPVEPIIICEEVLWNSLISSSSEPSTSAGHQNIIAEETQAVTALESEATINYATECPVVMKETVISHSSELYRGYPVNIKRLLDIHHEHFQSEKVKEKKEGGKVRLMVTCVTCKKYEHEVKHVSLNGQVHFSHGVRVEGQYGAK